MSKRVFFSKAVIPVISVFGLAFLFRPLCMVQGELDWRLLLLFVGIPFGIQKMFLWLVPTGMGISGTIGVAAFNLLLGGVIGSAVMMWKMLVAAITLIRGLFTGFFWITGISR